MLEHYHVALRKESVDRNTDWGLKQHGIAVALRKESVDRNLAGLLLCAQGFQVALRKESVDRNKSPVSLDPVVIRRSPQGERG